MQQYSAKNGVPGNWHLVHLGSRAVGGAGLILPNVLPFQRSLATLSDVGIGMMSRKMHGKHREFCT
jgi:2,4-dienoyl-CoA reductase-like NADH-dependent reductase (Old Yellow Enzyme family)